MKNLFCMAAFLFAALGWAAPICAQDSPIPSIPGLVDTDVVAANRAKAAARATPSAVVSGAGPINLRSGAYMSHSYNNDGPSIYQNDDDSLVNAIRAARGAQQTTLQTQHTGTTDIQASW